MDRQKAIKFDAFRLEPMLIKKFDSINNELTANCAKGKKSRKIQKEKHAREAARNGYQSTYGNTAIRAQIPKDPKGRDKRNTRRKKRQDRRKKTTNGAGKSMDT